MSILAQPKWQAPTAAPAGSQSEGSSEDDPNLRLLITSIVLQELALRDSRTRRDQPGRSKASKGRGRRGSGSEVKRRQAWAKEKARRQRQRQEQALDDSRRQPAVRLHHEKSISRGFLSWRRAAAETSRKATSMAVAAEHRSAGTPRKARDRLANAHHHLCWWRAFRAALAPFSQWPDPNAPSFVLPAAPPQGPVTKMRAAAARADTATSAPAELGFFSGPVSMGDAENSASQDERWQSWMMDYQRMKEPGICEGCGSSAKLWIMPGVTVCSTCGGELIRGGLDFTSDEDTLSEDY